MDYSTIMLKLEEKGRGEASRFRSYCLKHPRKSKDKRDGSLFWFSLGRQVRDFIDGKGNGFKTPLSEKQSRYADKVCPGAYAFIQTERRKAGGWGNHIPKCPVLLGLNKELGLIVDTDGVVICEGCNAELGRFREPVEPETFPVNLDAVELAETIDLDAVEVL